MTPSRKESPVRSWLRLWLGAVAWLALVTSSNGAPEPGGSDWWDRLDRSSWPGPGTAVEDMIDAAVGTGLAEAGLAPASPADDATLLRRVTLDLAGRIPAWGEIERYGSDSGAADRWDRTVDGLLASDSARRFLADEFHWLLTDGRSSEFRKYVVRAVEREVRWPELFAEVIRGRPDGEALAGVDGFVRERAADLDQLTNDVSVKFFGVNISCAQCHDHPYVPSWTQETYYGMKAFFARTFDNGGFAGERGYGELAYKTVKGEERQAVPRFLGAEPIAEPAAVVPTEEEKKAERVSLEAARRARVAPEPPGYSRRERVVAAGLEGEHELWFARALVNRVWYRMFGTGLVMPLDQMHGRNEPSHPELLQWLAEDLVAHGYDLRRLLGGMARSQTYRRSSAWPEGQERPAASVYAVATVRPLSPRQYGIALRLATADPSSLGPDVDAGTLAQRLQALEAAGEGLAVRFERPREAFYVAVDEALCLSNHEGLDRQLLGSGLVPALARIPSFGERMGMAFRVILARNPGEDEVAVLREYDQSRRDQSHAALEQIVWALLTSAEARFNH